MQKEHTNRDYYEAILQLRPAKSEAMEYVRNQLEHNPSVFISKTIELKTGVDLYLSDRKFTAALSKRLKNVFKAKIIVSRSLFTQNRLTSKFVYRMTYCVRF
jgi:NMD protein affecting ribosome stability and mRNA decay